MQKILLPGIAALVLAAAAAAPAGAEDRLALSGSMRARGFFGDTTEYGNEKVQFFDQRLRLGGKLTVADGVFVNFRFDAAEEAWGKDGNKNANREKALQWDKANLELDQKGYNLVAGQQYFGFGNAIAVDHIGAGLSATVKGMLPVTLIYTKLSEGDSLGDHNNNTSADGDIYGASIGHKGEGYESSLFFARLQDRNGDYLNNDGDLNIVGFPFVFGSARANVVGLTYNQSFGKVDLALEGDHFFGSAADLAGNNIDVVGTQVYADVALNASESTKFGLMGFYALSADNAKNEAQFTQLSDWQDWDPCTCGHHNAEYSMLPSGDYETFDFTGNDAGVIGVQPYSEFSLTKDLSLNASAYLYLPEDDNANGNTIDSTLGGNLSVEYLLLPNTAITVQGSYNYSNKVAGDDDLKQYMVLSQLAVMF